MDKPYISEVIIVEGKTDKQFLLSFLNADIIETNGSAISEEFLNELVEISKKREVLVITDPDSPGEKIRNTIIQKIPKTNHIYLDKKDSLFNGKVGLAQCQKEYVLKKLKEVVMFNKQQLHLGITIHDLFELGLVGLESSFKKRSALCKKLKISTCNGKQLLQKVNWMKMNLDLLKGFIN